ncbi:beta-2-microglobulin [Bufo bufo]|uniref:beta-2-microglobulin n=1 Tax=Bufo bufo TaxID=8384 RepID=UPI001ABDAA53|nr:beta-2-microglobulin [Bufo bufo]
MWIPGRTSAGALLLLGVALTLAEIKSPTVNVYTATPVEYGKKNTLICHCSGFHPPRIDMRLKKDGQDMADCQESDLAFEQDWTYYRSKHAEFTPKEGEVYECEVKHDEGKPQTYRLETF